MGRRDKNKAKQYVQMKEKHRDIKGACVIGHRVRENEAIHLLNLLDTP
jgi:hypothetical protein